VIRAEAAEAVASVLESGWLGMGPKTREFELAFAAFVQAPHCVAVSSGTAALQLGLRLLDLAPGASVVTTPLTFVSANQVILQEGLRPVFADIQPTTGSLDPASVAGALDRGAGAVIAMHYGGYPCDVDELYALCSERNVPLIEDCAHACGATYRGRPIGSHGELHAFSFQAVKNLPMGEGGALTLASEAHDRRARKLRWFGISADTYERARGHGYRWDYDVEELGYKHQLDDVHAGIGLVQLAHVRADNARRAEIAARYRGGLANMPGITLLDQKDDRESSHHLFCVLAENRDRLVDALSARGVDVSVHYRPSYDYALFDSEPLPNVEYFWRRVISLPMHLQLDDDDVDYVIEVIREGW
jgi:perosamine synthetase